MDTMEPGGIFKPNILLGHNKIANGMNVTPRDPYEINSNVQIMWNSVVAEPENLKSSEQVWKTSNLVFNFVQLTTYKLLTFVTAPFIAFILALTFGLLGFLQIWILLPVTRFLQIIFRIVRTLLELILQSVAGPVFETVGLLFSNLKVKHQRVPDLNERNSTYPFMI